MPYHLLSRLFVSFLTLDVCTCNIATSNISPRLRLIFDGLKINLVFTVSDRLNRIMYSSRGQRRIEGSVVAIILEIDAIWGEETNMSHCSTKLSVERALK